MDRAPTRVLGHREFFAGGRRSWLAWVLNTTLSLWVEETQSDTGKTGFNGGLPFFFVVGFVGVLVFFSLQYSVCIYTHIVLQIFNIHIHIII